MATHTTYYNLTKPAQNDKVNIGVLNDNADIIDTALHNKVNNDDTQNITTSANKCMMSDGVTSVEDSIKNSTLDNRTTITGDFTCPSDGYVNGIASTAGDYASCRIYGSNRLTDNVILLGVGYQSGVGASVIPVKKGMRVNNVSTTGNGAIRFIPFM